jgi:hypothetical protein
MGLPAGQRKELERIEGVLRGSDPRLAALFGTFGRLTRDEDMPRREALRNGVRLRAGLLRMRLASAGHSTWSLLARQPSLVFLPLAITVIALAIAFAVKAGHGGPCATRAGAAKTTAKSRTACNPPPMYPVIGK